MTLLIHDPGPLDPDYSVHYAAGVRDGLGDHAVSLYEFFTSTAFRRGRDAARHAKWRAAERTRLRHERLRLERRHQELLTDLKMQQMVLADIRMAMQILCQPKTFVMITSVD